MTISRDYFPVEKQIGVLHDLLYNEHGSRTRNRSVVAVQCYWSRTQRLATINWQHLRRRLQSSLTVSLADLL